MGRERTDLTPTDAQDDGEARQDASSDEDPAQATTQPRDPLVDDMNPDKHVQMTKSPLEGSLLKSSETPVEPEMSEIIRAELYVKLSLMCCHSSLLTAVIEISFTSTGSILWLPSSTRVAICPGLGKMTSRDLVFVCNLPCGH